MATTLRMEIDELNNIKDQVETYMRTVSTEVEAYTNILNEFADNQYMKGSIEATQLIRDKVVSATSNLDGEISSFVALLSQATLLTAETEAEYSRRFQNIAGDDFSQNSSNAQVIESTGVQDVSQGRLIDRISSINTDPALLQQGYIQYNATAYCKCSKCCGIWSNSPTAGGTTPEEGRTVAMAGNIPFFTNIDIAGLGNFVVEDRGSAITEGKIDIYFNSHEEALQFGRRTVYVKFGS